MYVESVHGGSLVLTLITVIQISHVLGLDVSLHGGGVSCAVTTVHTLPLAITQPQHFGVDIF